MRPARADLFNADVRADGHTLTMLGPNSRIFAISDAPKAHKRLQLNFTLLTLIPKAHVGWLREYSH